MSSLDVRILVCDREGCAEEFIHPTQYDGQGHVSLGQIRIKAQMMGWMFHRGRDICPLCKE